MKRAHKDKRARKHLLRLSLLLLAPAACLGYAAWVIGSGAWIILLFVFPLIWWRSRSEKRDSVPLHIAPTPAPVSRELTVEERRTLRLYFAELALIYAVLVDRAGSERYLKEKTLPEGVEVISRRNHLKLLKSIGVWERLTPADREAIMMPDGHWDWPRINQMAMRIEPLRLCRWILRIDFVLPLVGQQLSGDFTIAHELVLAPDKALGGKDLIERESMLMGRDAAQHYFIRCLSETISRGYHVPEDEKQIEWAKKLSASLKGQQNDDLILGSKLVGEAGREQLMWATTLAKIRSDFLSKAISFFDAGRPPESALDGAI